MNRLNNVFRRSASPFRGQRRHHATYTYQRYRPNDNAGSGANDSNGGNSSKSSNDTFKNIRYNLDRIVAVPLLGEPEQDTGDDESRPTETESNDASYPLTTSPSQHIPYISIPFTRNTFTHMQEITNKAKYENGAYHHEKILPKELEYYGIFRRDGETVTTTHGTVQKPIKSCILRGIEPTIVADTGQSSVYEILRMVSFEPEEITPELIVEAETILSQAQPTNTGEAENSASVENEIPEEPVVAPIKIQKFHFRKRTYNLSDPKLDTEAPVFVFRKKEGEEAHKYVALWKEQTGKLMHQIVTGAKEFAAWFQEKLPWASEKIVTVYDHITFCGLLAWQVGCFIYRGEIFMPSETKDVSRYWCGDAYNSTSKHARRATKRALENFTDIQSADCVTLNDPPTIIPVDGTREAEIKSIITQVWEKEEPDDRDHSEVGEMEILPKRMETTDTDETSDKYILVHYQLIYQASILPGFLTTLGYKEPEYFYHKFIFFEPATNAIHVISKGINDDQEIKILRKFRREHKDKLDFSYREPKPGEKTYVRKFFSHMVYLPLSENETEYINEYTDEQTKTLTWKSWISKRALNMGIHKSHQGLADNTNDNSLRGSCVENILKFVEVDD